ncbi:MAG: ABC transporter permease subunit [Simkaniaceae bacterium]|nr:ABC transporter permease subunit [Simkaniaceae bacterium]
MKQHIRSPWRVARQKLMRDPAAIMGLAFVCLIVFAGLFAPLIAPMDPNAQVLEFMNQPPGFSGEVIRFRLRPDLPVQMVAVKEVNVNGNRVEYIDHLNRTFTLHKNQLSGDTKEEWYGTHRYWLGTDNFGRDVLSRLLYGARISLLVGISASTLSLIVGLLLGAVAGYYGGWLETIIMRFTDIMFGFPTLLFLIGITAAFEPSLLVVFVAIGFVSWPGMARLMRGQVLAVKEREFVKAATVLGFSKWHVLWKHVVPNCLAPVIVAYTLGIAGAIMAEASLSFLGLGAQPPISSWGAMINTGKDFLRMAPWISMMPGVAIAMTVLGFNLLGDGLRDALDPTMKE